ncbi:MAG TPA: bL35 family ribosomal protein [Thermoflexales bacterium]|nr:bL35 family ribosomal protein [Thermoflexales bacterium]HQW35224.1 bL35 family ribosomal protein [Thermoflexales bacterium]HQZ21885.1 bL35 family ribosomal protein [Thermoflexales bacterium]
MPKIKTHKSTSKRFRVTGTGKVMRTRLGKSHLRRKKPSRVKSEFPEMFPVQGKAQIKRIKMLAPYLKDK